MAGTVMPAPKFIGLDNNANPVSGGKLYTYVAGTTTPQATYSDVNLTVANANPVVLDSAGRATVFLSGSSYKFVLKDSDDVTIWTQDNVQAVAPFSTNLDIQGVAGEAILAGQACYLSDGSGALTAGRWYLADADNAYSSSLPQVAMAPDAIDAGETGTFRLQGSVTKSNAQADFVVGDTYYVSATAGLLSLSPGTNVRVMGQADSTTTIVISPNPPNIATTPTFIDGITVTSTDAGAAAAPYLDLYRESASPAASDQIGEITFSGEDSAGNKQLYARVYGQIADPTSTSEDGQVRIATMKAGVETTHLVIDETGQVLPDQAGQALGSATKQFADLFLESGAVVNFDNGNTTLTHSAGKLTVAGSGAGALDVKGTLSPTANDGAAIGSGTVSWADLFLASGGVINFNNGDVTVTHSSNTLTFAGAASGYIFNDGNVGIGTASIESGFKLHVVGNGFFSSSTGTITKVSVDMVDQRLVLGSYFEAGVGQTAFISATNNAETGDTDLDFRTGTTSRLRITSGGNVLIGTTTSVNRLTVAETTSSSGVVFIGNAVNTASAEFGRIRFGSTASSSAYVNYGGQIASFSGGGIDVSDLRFYTGNGAASAERARITSGGDVAIGATAKLYLDGVAGTGDTYITESSANTVRGYVGGTFAWQSGSTIWYFQTEISVPSGQEIFLDGGPAAGGGDSYLSEAGANVIRVTVGGVSAVQWDTTGMYLNIAPPTSASAANAVVSSGSDYLRRSTSSIRYKHDIATLDTTDALSAVMAMRPVTYRGKTDEDQRRFVGFIAEEMQEIAPLLCTYDEGGESGTPNYVTYDRVTAYLVAVVQQQQTEINALKARIH